MLGNLNVWFFWAYYAAGLFVGATTLLVHLWALRMPGGVGPWLLVVAAYLGCLGAIIGGFQTGTNPLIPAMYAVPLVRITWSSGITLLIVASGLYLWSMRERKPAPQSADEGETDGD
jgi:hypothetical protein